MLRFDARSSQEPQIQDVSVSDLLEPGRRKLRLRG
jgi:hypothetical protein